MWALFRNIVLAAEHIPGITNSTLKYSGKSISSGAGPICILSFFSWELDAFIEATDAFS